MVTDSVKSIPLHVRNKTISLTKHIACAADTPVEVTVLIRATLSVKMPELWVCQITEKYNVEISGKVGGNRAKAAGWCLVEIRGRDELLDTVIDEILTCDNARVRRARDPVLFGIKP
jgi:hypothetical protein